MTREQILVALAQRGVTRFPDIVDAGDDLNVFLRAPWGMQQQVVPIPREDDPSSGYDVELALDIAAELASDPSRWLGLLDDTDPARAARKLERERDIVTLTTEWAERASGFDEGAWLQRAAALAKYVLGG